jgi:hypothetical protein
MRFRQRQIMRQRGYLIAFVLVLLIACVGGFFGGRFLIRRLQQDFGSQSTWAPPTMALQTPQGQVTPAPLLTVRPDPSPSGAVRPVSTAPAPTRIQVTVPAPASVETPVSAEPSSGPTPTETETVLPSPSPVPVFPFLSARPVRHSSGDCPGSYILGQVTDRSGTPLPDVRLLLVDEYGNQEIKVTKGGADAGRYDFPVFGPPRRFYLSVVDGNSRPISPRIEIPHGVGADAQGTCHWADWRRQ